MRALILYISFTLVTSLFGQSNAVRSSRLAYSQATTEILNQLDSLLYLDTLNNGKPDLEYRIVGEASKVSNKFLLYAELVKVAAEKELLDILNNPKELTPVRGYAYMAYALKCDQQKIKEKNLNYNFKLDVQNGCIVQTNCSFSEFKKDIRVRNKYDPNPKYSVIDSEEKKAIKKENKIRKEQGENLRKE